MNTVTVYGRTFGVLASFENTDHGGKEANAFMLANPNSGLLDIADGRLILAAMDDQGTPIHTTTESAS